MPNEVAWQAKLRKKVEAGGAYCKKWASDYVVGVPDLVYVGGSTVFVEVKLEKSWTKKSTRTIKLSPKQIIEGNKIVKAGGAAKVLVIIEKYVGTAELILCDFPEVGCKLTLTPPFKECTVLLWAPRTTPKELIDFLEGRTHVN